MKIAAIFIFLFPLLSSIITGLFRNIICRRSVSIIACGSMGIASLAAFILFYCNYSDSEPINIIIGSWFLVDHLDIHYAIHIDALSSIMFAMVTMISFVVHVYSIGYMEDDPHIHKFFSFLSLFTFFMLLLVAADNFLQLFFGWEGVGLCSYLLIGFWHQKPAANAAAFKAFIINRVSDFAFIIGVVLLITYTNSLNFDTIFKAAPALAANMVNIGNINFSILDIACFLLFVGCMGKSAQIGLHIWLPDAMEGPTPVSALIHAATMVTAGVFLLAKCSYLFEYSPLVLNIIAIIGGITAFFAATIAITQTDIKKIIAYSTCSQLGYMFLACGISAYRTAIFHLLTHAFFKALLFLSAGSVIHATHEQDITKMGGLKDKMPWTYANFLAGSLAIIGIFPLSGFYSKDLIMEAAYNHGLLIGNIIFILGIISALFTALYSIKIIILTFHGNSKLTNLSKVHEVPKIMNLPLIILTAGSFCAGAIGYYILRIDKGTGYLNTSIFNLQDIFHHQHVNLLIKFLPLIMGISGIILGVIIYRKSFIPTGPIYKLLKNKYYFDEIYNMTIVKSVNCFSYLCNLFDQRAIDRFGPNGFAHIVNYASSNIRQLQTGYIFNYAFMMVLFITICISFFLISFIIGS